MKKPICQTRIMAFASAWMSCSIGFAIGNQGDTQAGGQNWQHNNG